MSVPLPATLPATGRCPEPCYAALALRGIEERLSQLSLHVLYDLKEEAHFPSTPCTKAERRTFLGGGVAGDCAVANLLFRAPPCRPCLTTVPPRLGSSRLQVTVDMVVPWRFFHDHVDLDTLCEQVRSHLAARVHAAADCCDSSGTSPERVEWRLVTHRGGLPWSALFLDGAAMRPQEGRLPKTLGSPFWSQSTPLHLEATAPLPGSPPFRLRDVHRHVPPPPLARGDTASVTTGCYEYYHYLQDGLQDKGWGCAYRALQTIFSWYSLNGFTTETVPSHRRIQEVLVENGDKPGDFLGSKGWIGSFEIALVLQAIVGAQSKLLHLSGPKDLPSATTPLLEHFSRHGPPVMIGSGDYAFVLLGVIAPGGVRQQSPRVLVLDPHYAGVDDAAHVTAHRSRLAAGRVGRACEWRELDSLPLGAFSNLVLPQVHVARESHRRL
uniref:UFSP1/2/DUB catalytic domain-containing protein n=1 Tax=Rhizochromulina marina TaxID=1034831 RepID=A0A7S2WQ21_9STRA|mmetsp:Transcript_30725/g.89253  ORF Transcript_30725/g.89253 Transcript_30725/m.89253 type:complete len:439 (+) Transcript_30725:680-1996(+)